MVVNILVAEASNALTNLPAPPERWIWHVATPHEFVRAMLWLADVSKTDVVYDLGSGDGRIPIAAVRDFGARKAVGIEIDPKLVAISQSNATKAGVARRVKFIHGDLFTNDFSEGTVVTLYLSREANLELRPKIFQLLKPGTRIVSHQFGMGEWLPHKEFRIRAPFLGMYGQALEPVQSLRTCAGLRAGVWFSRGEWGLALDCAGQDSRGVAGQSRDGWSRA